VTNGEHWEMNKLKKNKLVARPEGELGWKVEFSPK
jgi:hypothetical protein